MDSLVRWAARLTAIFLKKAGRQEGRKAGRQGGREAER